ncbi:hypothetical protein [Sulfoacidibacillus ferrooxidans]|uniref:hypothetical protein n=1 Tax=Sulfoacidibacillus ferrooxidans TaxID=2005001 RepID=UPI001F50B813|nr:hypothetical protein [Sulfoacidibacillus ferrooxidans]
MATGSLRTVRSYVQYRKEHMKLENAPSYQRLEHSDGKAQADFIFSFVSITLY